MVHIYTHTSDYTVNETTLACLGEGTVLLLFVGLLLTSLKFGDVRQKVILYKMGKLASVVLVCKCENKETSCTDAT